MKSGTSTRDEHLALVAQLRTKLAAAARGGPERARERHVARGKLLPRDRVDGLLDPGSPLLEIAPLAADGMYEGAAPAAGVPRITVPHADRPQPRRQADRPHRRGKQTHKAAAPNPAILANISAGCGS